MSLSAFVISYNEEEHIEDCLRSLSFCDEVVVIDSFSEDRTVEIGWFIAEACLALGMIGTVTGFLLMLNGAFMEIDLSNPTTIQNSLVKMALGMSTALYTTLTGLICSLALKIQLVNVENEYREF